MEGVGARFGRSSTRYGPATVFSGPVRKWKKRWIHVSPPPSSSSSSATTSNNNNIVINNNNGTTSNGNNGSHLLLFKWTPLTHSNHKDAATSNSNSNSNPNPNPNSNSNSNSNSNNNNNNNNKAVGNGNANPDETDACHHQHPPKRKFKYIPVYLIEQQKKEAEENEEQVDDETKLSDNDPKAAGSIPRKDGLDEKPNINDVPMEENQDGNQVVRQDLNESTLDLSLGLKSHDGDSDSMADQSRDGQ